MQLIACIVLWRSDRNDIIQLIRRTQHLIDKTSSIGMIYG